MNGSGLSENRWSRWFPWLFLCALVALIPVAWLFQESRVRRDVAILEGINNAKNLVLSIHNHSTTDQGRIPRSPEDRPPRSWRTIVLQFLDRADLQRKYDDDLAWNQGPNLELSQTYLKVWENPRGARRKQDSVGRYLTDFGLISGPGTVAPPQGRVSLDDISHGDGMTQTLMLGECSGLGIVWTEPRDPDVSREQTGIEHLSQPGQRSNKLLSTYSPFGVIVGFADGRVRTLSHAIDPQVLKTLCTIDGHEPVQQSDYAP